MFKYSVKYTDYNGVEREEPCFFNLSKAELMEMELSTQAGVEEMIRVMIATKDNAKIVQMFKDLILKSFGIKSEDGRRFIKSKELREDFEQSEAYSEFFIKLLANEDDLQTKFINGVISGANVPNMDPEETIAKLKEMGYGITKPADVVPMNREEVVDDKNK